MVKLNAPAMSLDASGSLAGAIVFSKWKGRNYARQLVIPSNPKSAKQISMRAMFSFLTKEWTALTVGDKGDWDTDALVGKFSPFNAFVKHNQTRWRNLLYPSTVTPSTEAGTAPSALTGTATAGTRQITLALTHGTNIADWGVAIFRALGSAVTPAIDNLVHVMPVTAGGDATWIDTPLTAGAYHYKAIGFMKTGKSGTVSADITATVT